MKKPREGDIYKVIEHYGRHFELRYGYYESFERESEFGEPIPIYPDFLKNPEYTEDGYPFVTQMQESCKRGKGDFAFDACCAYCIYFEPGDELIGICRCENRRRRVLPDASAEKHKAVCLEENL